MYGPKGKVIIAELEKRIIISDQRSPKQIDGMWFQIRDQQNLTRGAKTDGTYRLDYAIKVNKPVLLSKILKLV